MKQTAIVLEIIERAIAAAKEDAPSQQQRSEYARYWVKCALARYRIERLYHEAAACVSILSAVDGGTTWYELRQLYQAHGASRELSPPAKTPPEMAPVGAASISPPASNTGDGPTATQRSEPQRVSQRVLRILEDYV